MICVFIFGMLLCVLVLMVCDCCLFLVNLFMLQMLKVEKVVVVLVKVVVEFKCFVLLGCFMIDDGINCGFK